MRGLHLGKRVDQQSIKALAHSVEDRGALSSCNWSRRRNVRQLLRTLWQDFLHPALDVRCTSHAAPPRLAYPLARPREWVRPGETGQGGLDGIVISEWCRHYSEGLDQGHGRRARQSVVHDAHSPRLRDVGERPLSVTRQPSIRQTEARPLAQLQQFPPMPIYNMVPIPTKGSGGCKTEKLLVRLYRRVLKVAALTRARILVPDDEDMADRGQKEYLIL